MKKKIWIGIGVAAIILIMVGVSVFRTVFAKAPTVETAVAEMEEITSELIIPGTLELSGKQAVYRSPELGEVKEIHVKEGDEVKAGDLLVTFENEQLELELAQNKLSVESGYLRINQVEKQLDDLKKQKKDLAKQVGEKEAEKQFDSQIEQLDMEKRMANLDLKQVLLQKEQLEKQIGKLKATSKIDGTVIAVNEDPAQSETGLEEPVVMVGQLNQLSAKGLLSEYDALRVKIGQKATLYSDALPDEKYEGEITEIGHLPETSSLAAGMDNQAAQYSVTVKINSKKVSLKPGFQLIMEIETEKKKSLVIPSEALQYEGDKTFVYVVEDGIAKMKEVTPGISSVEKVEIVEGLEEGEKVILNPDESIADGTEVTVK